MLYSPRACRANFTCCMNFLIRKITHLWARKQMLETDVCLYTIPSGTNQGRVRSARRRTPQSLGGQTHWSIRKNWREAQVHLMQPHYAHQGPFHWQRRWSRLRVTNHWLLDYYFSSFCLYSYNLKRSTTEGQTTLHSCCGLFGVNCCIFWLARHSMQIWKKQKKRRYVN